MRSIEIGPRLGLALITLLGTACTSSTTTTSPPSPSRPAPTPSVTEAPASSAPSAPTSAGLDLPAPGRPFDAATLLAAMRGSLRPGGVPDEIETEAIATAVAEAIWTIDGRSWTTSAVGASCGPASCTLEVAGAAADAHGDDVWVFAVSPTSGAVELVSADLRSLPVELLVPLDEMARSVVTDGSVASLLLASVRWLPPPDSGGFVLSYRSGGEEGSCRVDVTLDAADGVLVSNPTHDC